MPDEVCANQQRLTHVELMAEYLRHGFICEDLFVLVRKAKPGVSRMLRQSHAKKKPFLLSRISQIVWQARWEGHQDSIPLEMKAVT